MSIQNPHVYPYKAEFIASIIQNLSKHDSAVRDVTTTHQPEPANNAPNSSSPLSTLPPDLLSKINPLFLTLHCIFPNELLLALDILDRGLVTRPLCPLNERRRVSQEGSTLERGDDGIYFVRSSAPPTRGTRPGAGKSYIVCLNAWNCTCPAFTLAAFRDIPSDFNNADEATTTHPVTGEQQQSHGDPTTEEGPAAGRGYSWRFGGTLTNESYGTPVCKHILACLLGTQCPALFNDGVEEVVAVEEEIAGRHAGWVD